MGNIKLEDTGRIGRDRAVDSLSRYANSIVYFYGEDGKLTFETYKRQPASGNENESSFLITPGVEYRPDLVSSDIFGTPNLWWKIMERNNMKDILEFKAGKTIKIPDTENIF